MKKIIFFGSADEVLHQMYKDLSTNEEIIYKRGMINLNSKIKNIIFRMMFSKRINNYFNLPLKNYWFPLFLKYDDDIDQHPIFIFTKDNFKYLEFGYANFLKNQYPNCRIILLFLDIHGLRDYNLKQLVNLYDEAFVFDEYEAEKNKISYYPLCYSHSQFENQSKKYDLCFIGQDKGRIDKIKEIYINAKKVGLKTKIIICGKFENKSEYPFFEFVDCISYSKSLDIISQSKFNLEICLEDTSAISIRLYEAIMFNQGLITNNENIVNSPYYDPSFVHLLNLDNIDLTFVKSYQQVNNITLKNQISPLRFADFIQKKYF